MLRAPIVVILLLASFNVDCSAHSSVAPVSQGASSSHTDKQEWELLKQRFNSKPGQYISAGMWSLIHTYRSEEQMKDCMNLVMLLSEAVAKDDPSGLAPMGGLEGTKQRFLQLMNSDDDTVSGYAAIALAVIGDQAYAEKIAALLSKPNPKGEEDPYPPITVRGRAATALGILGAKTYTPKIAALLNSKNQYDRSGAVQGLAVLGAREQAPNIARVLTIDDHKALDDDSAIYALVELGVAGEYVKEIAATLGDRFGSERGKTAAYALAHLRAKQYAPAIAKLLSQQYRRADAAKALAIMGAAEYAAEIAQLLNSKSSLDQMAAAEALGVLNARSYIPQVAKLLKAREGFVTHGAADALILLEAEGYAGQALKIIDHDHQSGPYVIAMDFHPLVKDEVEAINSRYLDSMARMRQKTH